MEKTARMYRDQEKILVSREEIAAKIRELGETITRDYAGREPLMVCVLKGAALFFTTAAVTDLFTLVVLWIVRRLDGVLEDQRHYLNRLRREQEKERGGYP